MPDFVGTIHELAEEATRRQEVAAKHLASQLGKLSEAELVERIAVLQAQEFRRGINLTLEVYGLQGKPLQ